MAEQNSYNTLEFWDFFFLSNICQIPDFMLMLVLNIIAFEYADHTLKPT